MTYFESIAVSPGGAVTAVGTLASVRSGHVLAAHMEGDYQELSRELGGDSVLVQGLIDPPLGEVVTVRGTWSGAKISEARVAKGQAGIAPPAGLDPGYFGGVPGAAERSDVLRAEVLERCDSLRGNAMVSFVAVPGPRGWFGLAAAVDTEVVQARLGALLGSHLLVVPSEWTLGQLKEVERCLSSEKSVRNIGAGWDPFGRYRVHCLLHHLTPELAALLDAFPPGAVHVQVWLRPAE